MSSVLQFIYDKRGLIYTLMCALILTASDLFVKLIIDHISVLQLTTLRMAVELSCSIPCLVVREDGRYFKEESRKEYKLLAIRSLFATASAVFAMLAYSYTDMGSVTAVFNTMPVFSGLIGWMFLKEKFTKIELLLSVVSLSGVFLIAQPPFIFPGNPDNGKDDSHFVGTIFAFVSAIVTAVSFVLSRLLSKRNVHSVVILFHYAAVGTVVPAILNFVIGSWSSSPCGLTRLFILLIGVLAFSSQSLLVEALKIEKPVRVTVTLTLNILFAFLVQFIFLDEVPDIFSLFGAIAIFVASVGMSLQRSKTSQEIAVDHDDSQSEHL